MMISGCGSKNKEKVVITSNASFCQGAKPFYSLNEPFDEVVSNEMIDMIYLHDKKYNCLCLNIKEDC